MMTMDKWCDDLTWTDPHCPTARTLDIIGDKWSLLIIRDAMDNARTFSEFHQRTGIARNILSDRLHKLVSRGILMRMVNATGRRHEYQLTDKGHDLFPIILALRQWGEQYAFNPGENHSTLVDEQENPLPKFRPRDVEGNPLCAGNTYVMEVDP